MTLISTKVIIEIHTGKKGKRQWLSKWAMAYGQSWLFPCYPQPQRIMSIVVQNPKLYAFFLHFYPLHMPLNHRGRKGTQWDLSILLEISAGNMFYAAFSFIRIATSIMQNVLYLSQVAKIKRST